MTTSRVPPTLVEADDLDRMLTALRHGGSRIRYLWSESRWIEWADGSVRPSAFVADGPGGEVDVHVVAVDAGRPTPLSASDVVLPCGALGAIGSIAGVAVPCATTEAQLVMHGGYELPPHHRADVERLRALA